MLIAVAAGAVIAATTLTTVALSADEPDRCCPAGADGPVTGPSPTTRAAETRAAGPPMCLIGSWRSVEEIHSVKFYTDQPPMQFVGTERRYEFRPDGTGTEIHANSTLSSNWRGRQLKIVGNGSVQFTWKATDNQITYMAISNAQLNFQYYDNRGLLNTLPYANNPALNEVDDYICQGTQMAEGNSNGYHSAWVRTTGFGVYG